MWFGAVAALLLGLMQEILSKRREKQKLKQYDTKIKALEEENETLKKRIKQLEEELKKLKEWPSTAYFCLLPSQKAKYFFTGFWS